MFELEKIIKSESEKYDSFYLYDGNSIIRQIRNLKRDFPQVEFLYSLKCNPNAHMIDCIFSEGFGADAASPGEVELAYQHGIPQPHLYYSAPGKTENDINQAWGKAIIIADSLSEIERIHNIAEERKEKIQIGIRINPSFSFYGDKGCPSKFGIDEDQAVSFLSQYASDFVSVTGIHVHLKSQELRIETLAEYWKNIFLLAKRMQSLCKSNLRFINFGSGMGIPYSAEDIPLDTQRLGNLFSKQLNDFQKLYPDTKLLIESGRYIVGKSGYYITKVLDRKISCGKTYLILKNTLNGFIRPSLAMLVDKYSADSTPAPSEPLFTGKNAFEFFTLKQAAEKETVTLTGNLCTAADVIAENILLPHLDIGDVIIISNAGAYGAAISPMQFSSMDKPHELFVSINN